MYMEKSLQTPGGKTPELLCPAGSPLALDAAIEGGADAVYLGLPHFNARIHASNFDRATLPEAIRRAHRYGVKVYLTLNTLLYDRELLDAVRAADFAARSGADALIVADLGVASAIHRALPELSLHASTQAGAHHGAAGEVLRDMGFCRMVVARELSLEGLRETVKRSPIEVEAFIHGALCVCHSGQCLFSSLVGGRSGNRGECAQPCRLPFRTPAGRPDYPLSLKDLSLARHLPALLDTGLASLKIEGRMRSPEYVLTVSRIWRRLLDERRSANDDEMARLAEAFSREGFTDGYFTSRITSRMLGVRSEQNKQACRALTPFEGLSRRIGVSMDATLALGQPATLTVSTPTARFTATGEVVQAARTAPLDEAAVWRQLKRLGNTCFEATDCRLVLDGGVMLPVSALNALRRAAIEGLEQQLDRSPALPPLREPEMPVPRKGRAPLLQRSAQMQSAAQLTQAALHDFDVCYLPSDELLALSDEALATAMSNATLGVTLPPVIMPAEEDAWRDKLTALRGRGIRRALMNNPGQLPLLRSLGMDIDGGLHLGVTNTASVALWESLGVNTPILSPELRLPQVRDIEGEVRTVVYGRIPLMILEKCVIREISDCQSCAKGEVALVDRRGVSFPVVRLGEHRNIIYNSLPTYMADEQDALARYRTGGWHFIFSTESPDEVDRVVSAFRNRTAATVPVRRIGKA